MSPEARWWGTTNHDGMLGHCRGHDGGDLWGGLVTCARRLGSTNTDGTVSKSRVLIAVSQSGYVVGPIQLQQTLVWSLTTACLLWYWALVSMSVYPRTTCISHRMGERNFIKALCGMVECRTAMVLHWAYIVSRCNTIQLIKRLSSRNYAMLYQIMVACRQY